MKVFDTHKTRMIGLPCGEETMTVFPWNAAERVTHGQADRITISISRVSTLTRDNKIMLGLCF